MDVMSLQAQQTAAYASFSPRWRQKALAPQGHSAPTAASHESFQCTPAANSPSLPEERPARREALS